MRGCPFRWAPYKERYNMRKKRVVFYGRVSTTSEEQLSALENQMQWYQDLVEAHPEWEVVGVYEDEGITGTSYRKRKDFMKMMEDGIEHHKFDLIVTRETKRFARNTVDTLSWTRRLAGAGIGVYFVCDNINTLEDKDGELRLSIMATIAQEESRKTSENVKAGQRVSRDKGVLRGSGNILGYNRVGRNKYVINEEQAEIVRKIFNWYIEGKGIRTIKTLLEGCGYKTATGLSRWQELTIGFILSNPFYIGKQRQLLYVSNGYLTQMRVKNDTEKIEYVEGEYEPIISEEMFNEVQRIKVERRSKIGGKGVKRSMDIWTRKFSCICGCGITKKEGGKNTKYPQTMYRCSNQYRNRSIGYQIEHGIEIKDMCALEPMISWKLEMIAYYMIKKVWTVSKDDIEQAISIIKECYKVKNVASYNNIKGLMTKKEKLENRRNNLIDMRADGEISKEEYITRKNECDAEIIKINTTIEEAQKNGRTENELNKTFSQIRSALGIMVDFSKPVIDHNLLENIIWRMVHIAPYEIDIYLSMGNDNFGEVGTEIKTIKYKIFSSYETNKAETIKCTKLTEIMIDYEMAEAYRKMSNHRVKKPSWHDIKLNIYI